MSQSEVAGRTGLTRETPVRLERSQLTEFGSRKLLAVLAVFGLEMNFVEAGMSGTLDELRRAIALVALWSSISCNKVERESVCFEDLEMAVVVDARGNLARVYPEMEELSASANSSG